MKLTNKDKDFLETLRVLFSERALSIDLKEDGPARMVLRKNYGDRIEKAFGLTRQGVRWRFHRVFSEIYVSAYETIYLVERYFGPELRAQAMAIARQRVELRRRAQEKGRIRVYRRGKGQRPAVQAPSQL